VSNTGDYIYSKEEIVDVGHLPLIKEDQQNLVLSHFLVFKNTLDITQIAHKLIQEDKVWQSYSKKYCGCLRNGMSV